MNPFLVEHDYKEDKKNEAKYDFDDTKTIMICIGIFTVLFVVMLGISGGFSLSTCENHVAYRDKVQRQILKEEVVNKDKVYKQFSHRAKTNNSKKAITNKPTKSA